MEQDYSRKWLHFHSATTALLQQQQTKQTEALDFAATVGKIHSILLEIMSVSHEYFISNVINLFLHKNSATIQETNKILSCAGVLNDQSPSYLTYATFIKGD